MELDQMEDKLGVLPDEESGATYFRLRLPKLCRGPAEISAAIINLPRIWEEQGCLNPLF